MELARRTVILFSIFFAFSLSAFAGSDDVIIVQDTSSKPAISVAEAVSSSQGEDIEVVYDPAALSVSVESRSRESLLAEIPYEYQTYMASLTDGDIEVFLAKKKSFLDGIQNGLKKIYFSQKKIDSIISNLDHQFYQSAKVITQSNSYGMTYSLYLKGGLGFSDSIVEGIRKRNGWTKRLSERSANFIADQFQRTSKFFYLIGLTFSLERVQDPKTGKHFFILDAFAQTHFLKSIGTFLNFIDYDLAILGIIAEKRAGDFDKLIPDQLTQLKYETDHLGVVGRVRRSEDMFNFQTSTHIPGITLSFPPIIPSLSFFKDKGSEYRLFSINLTKLSPARFLDFFKSMLSSQIKSLQCRKMFAL